MSNINLAQRVHLLSVLMQHWTENYLIGVQEIHQKTYQQGPYR